MELKPEVRKNMKETFTLLTDYECDDSEFDGILNLWNSEMQSFINFCLEFHSMPRMLWKRMYRYMQAHSKQVLDNTEKGLLFMPVEIAAALPSRRMDEIMNYTVKEAKTELAKVQVQLDSALQTIKQMKQKSESDIEYNKCLANHYELQYERLRCFIKDLAEKVDFDVSEKTEPASAEDEDGESAEYYAD